MVLEVAAFKKEEVSETILKKLLHQNDVIQEVKLKKKDQQDEYLYTKVSLPELVRLKG